MLIHIEASDLPGLTCGPSGDFPGYGNIHVGVQRRDRRDALLDLHPGDAPSATWTLECTATPASGGGFDVKGPYIQGRPGGRFIYLNWGTVDDGVFTMFRRAKLFFDAIDPETMEAAVKSGRLTARLGLTDAKGHPLCAAVRPPLVEWS